MPRTILPFVASDISALARALRSQLAERTTPPGHLELLNMLARATGSRNYQHFRARTLGAEDTATDSACPRPEPARAARVARALRHFDDQGRLANWPARTALQHLCLWALWADFPRGHVLGEKEVNAFLKSRNGFRDHAILRRELCNTGLLSRARDGSAYRRVERKPPDEALMLIRLSRERRRQAA